MTVDKYVLGHSCSHKILLKGPPTSAYHQTSLILTVEMVKDIDEPLVLSDTQTPSVPQNFRWNF